MINHVKFIHCKFDQCYFRKTKITQTEFTGCKFLSCNFNKTTITGCRLWYSSFDGCFIPYQQIKNSLPSEECNLCEEIVRNLSIEATKLGFFDEANFFRKEEIKAREKNLWMGIWSESEWHSKHFLGFRKKTNAILSWTISKINGLLFGYGQYLLWILANFALSVIIFSCAFFFLREDLIFIDSKKIPGFIDILYFTISRILPSVIDIGIKPISNLTICISIFASLWGMLLIGYLISYLFHWSKTK